MSTQPAVLLSSAVGCFVTYTFYWVLLLSRNEATVPSRFPAYRLVDRPTPWWQTLCTSFALPLLWLCFSLSMINAYAYSTASRPYRLFHADPQLTPNSKKTKGRLRWVHLEAYQPPKDEGYEETLSEEEDDDEEDAHVIHPLSSFFQGMFATGGDFTQWRAWTRLLQKARRSLVKFLRPHHARTEIRWDVLELHLWDPTIFQTHFFRWCTPLHLVNIIFGAPLWTQLMLTALLYAVSMLYENKLKDKAILYDQLMAEYNSKFVYPHQKTVPVVTPRQKTPSQRHHARTSDE